MTAAAAATALEARGVGKRYGRTWALDGCTLSLPEGSVVALVGPNGAGKTTLLHLAVGLVRPTCGELQVAGQIGFVAQDAPLYDNLTGAEHLRMARSLNRDRDRAWDGAAVQDRLRELAVPLDRPVRTLSGGQRAQVALALALGKKPGLLVLDEPMASLDPLARRELMQTLMAAVAETGMTVLLSSHLIADLERVSDYLVVLAGGRVQVAGEVADLLAQHRLVRAPRRDPERWPGGWTVVDAHHTERDSLLLVQTSEPVLDPTLQVSEPSLEELVLAYLAHPGARAVPTPMPPAPLSVVTR